MDEKAAFEEVYLAYFDRIYKAVYLRILNREDTEDIVQEAFVKAMNAYDSFDPSKASVYTWLNRIAMNTMIDHLRQRKREDVVPMETEIEPGADDPELEALTDGYAQEAVVILRQLKDDERELLMMRFGLELSYKEIARELGSNEKAVGRRVERLLDKCRRISGLIP
ncbi:MAG: RNA polymerase sigma factor [Butyrivibrio sp.]|nr:RNA polymerase sigma factor [Butyrivibrio sp.]